MKKYKFLSIRTFVIFIVLATIICIGLIKYKSSKQYEKIDGIISGEIDVMYKYDSGEKAYLEELFPNLIYATDAGRVSWTKDGITAITFGIRQSDAGMSYYYIDNAEAVDKIVDRLMKLSMCKMQSGVDSFSVGLERKWAVQMFAGSWYTLILSAETTESENCDVINVDIALRNNMRVGANLDTWVTDTWETDSFLLFDEQMQEFLEEIYDEYVDNITLDTLESWKKLDKVELENVFCHRHSVGKETKLKDENSQSVPVYIYDFPIDGTDCYVCVVKKRDVDTTVVNRSDVDIAYIRICNSEGEQIDFYDSSIEDIQEFIGK